MTDTENAAPGAAAENLIAPEAAAQQQTGEVAPLETKPDAAQEDPEAAAKAERDKAIRNLQRRVDRKHAQAAAADERARIAEQRASALEARLSGGETHGQNEAAGSVDPYQLAEQIAQVKAVNERSDVIARDGKKRFGAEFSEALQVCFEEAGPLFDQRGLPTGLGEAILDADDPAALLHHLGQDPDIAAELRGLRPAQIARRIAKIEAELSTPKQPKQSTAPKPVTPVKSMADTGGLSDALSADEWQRRFLKLRAEGRM